MLESTTLFVNTVMKEDSLLVKTEAETSVTAVVIPENSKVQAASASD